MSETTAVDLLRTYLETSARDLGAVRPLLADDLVWDLGGEVQTRSAEEFVERQTADLATGMATTDVEALTGDDERAAYLGWSTFTPHDAEEGMRLRLSEWVEVADGRITRISSVIVPPS